MTHYDSWWAVPPHLMTRTTLGTLDLPRTADGVIPVAQVTDRDGPIGRDTYNLYDVTQCPPTKASARQLASARANSTRSYTCGDCGAHTERPVPTTGTGAGMCAACRHIALLRAEQAQLAKDRELIADDLAAVLDGPPAVVVQIDPYVPPPTDSGRARPATALRIRTAGLDARRLADVTVRLVGKRASWVPDNAVDPDAGWSQLAASLDGHRLVVWSFEELELLNKAKPSYPGISGAQGWGDGYNLADVHREWAARQRRTSAAVVIKAVARRWRGVLDPVTRRLVDPLAPGTPDRTALLIATMTGRAL